MRVLLFALLAACKHPDDSGPADTDETDLAGDTEETDLPVDTDLAPLPELAADDVSLPFVTAGQSVPDGTLVLHEQAGIASQPLVLTVGGPFTVTGSTAPMEPLEERQFTVHYTGPTGISVNPVGVATFESGTVVATGRLAGVVGDRQLPVATWTPDDWGIRTVVDLPSAPNADGSTPWHDDSVLIVVPYGFVDRNYGVVTHLHGHNATLLDTVASQALVELFSYSGRNAVFVAPQGPVETASGDFGQLMDPGGHEHLVRDVLALLYRDGYLAFPAAQEQLLTSHSGGYYATAQIIDHGGLPIDAVHLFDSLYGESGTYEQFVLDGGVFRSNYTCCGGTDGNNAVLRSTLRQEGVIVTDTFDEDVLASSDVTIASTWTVHGRCMRDERAYGRWLVASGLSRTTAAPPELRTVTSSGQTAHVTWRIDTGADSWRVEGSSDGQQWAPLTTVTGFSADVPARAWIRVRALTAGVVSEPSDTYGATGDDWLVVDGFDRFLEGSYGQVTHDFAARVGSRMGVSFSTASNEAVAGGGIALADYAHVLWLLGDESTSDLTFDEEEQAALSAYVAGGGRLVVSGSEVGYASPTAFLRDTLHVTYVSDDAGTTSAGGFRFGVTYPEDYPDVLSGSTTYWSYLTGGGAAVGWNGQVAVVGFPLETLHPDDLTPAMAEVVSWVE